MTQQPTCAAILRAETGPCARCGYEQINQRHHPPPRTPIFEGPEECSYLPPKIGVCGHAEDEHEAGFNLRTDEAITTCWSCIRAHDDWGLSSPAAHPFQPAAEEPVDAEV